MFVPCGGGHVCAEYRSVMDRTCDLVPVPVVAHPEEMLARLRCTPSPQQVNVAIDSVTNARAVVYGRTVPSVSVQSAPTGLHEIYGGSDPKSVYVSVGNALSTTAGDGF